MKKIIVSLLLLTSLLHVGFAQDTPDKEKTKKDFSDILPKAGDFSIGMDMANFIKIINNNIGANNNNNMVTAFQSDIFGKYFLTDRSALRMRLSFGIDNSTNRLFVFDDVANLDTLLGNHPVTMAKTADTRKVRNTTLELGIGYEYRRSLWRLQGYAGAEIFGGMNLHKNIYEYGNPMTATNQRPTSAFSPTFGNGYRPLETKGGNTVTFGFGLFIGADLFICRNVSIGAEFAFEGRYNYTTELSEMTETWIMEQAYVHKELTTPSQSSFKVRPVGRLNLSFYF